MQALRIIHEFGARTGTIIESGVSRPLKMERQLIYTGSLPEDHPYFRRNNYVGWHVSVSTR